MVTYASEDFRFRGGAVTRTVLRGLYAAGVDRVVRIPEMVKINVDVLAALHDPADEELLEWTCDQTFTTLGNVESAELFPYCAPVLYHSRAGIAHAAFQAGEAVLGTPVFVDQSSCIEMLAAMNIGGRSGKLGLHRFTAQAVADGV